jgi:hypothetical protein
MTKTRDELSEVAASLLRAFDQFKEYYRCSHEDMLHAIAAAMAQMPDEDRERFRAAFDQIEEEMHGDSPNGSGNAA